MAIAQRRVRLLFVLFAGLLVLGALRAADLGLLQAPQLSALAQSQQVIQSTVTPLRGAILDRNGDALALTELGDDLSAYEVPDPNRAAALLAPLLQESVATLAHKLASHRGFQYLARQLPAARAERIESLGIAGISSATDNYRTYPFGSLAGQVLGGMHLSGSGAGGIEQEYNRQLAGQDGQTSTVYAGNGKPISVNVLRQTVPGATIRLTLDAALQQEAESVIAGVAREYEPTDVSAIALNPQTGAVLALANWPSANPNDPSTGANWKDNALELNYEPGSTFKIVAVGGALSDGLITPQTPFNIPSELAYDGRTIHDSTDHADETLTTTGIVAQSSNIGAVEIGERLGPARFHYWTQRFGFGAPTGIDLPGEELGIVPPLSDYNNFSMGNLPFGQGESVTPIQIANAYAAIADGGILRAPHLVASIGGVAPREPKGHRILSPTVAAEMRTILERVLEPGGTAAEIAIPGYTLAGKTGTANVAIPGGYSDTKYVASFVGFAPAQHPRIEIEVVVDQPQGGAIYGTDAPAHAWRQIMTWALRYLKIPPS
jgi:cell division protein FtsI (penicillin-binding protein 3)/stage V sporulation protein D (sporulation-specific penicillin-binding protein)